MAQKTLKSKIPYQDLTQTKQQELDREYAAVQAYTQNNLKDPNQTKYPPPLNNSKTEN